MTTVLVVVAVALAAAALYFVWTRTRLPWPSIGVAALTSAICFTVGGASGRRTSEPDLATVMGGLVGILCVVCAILSLIPRDPDDSEPSRAPLYLATGATLVGAVGLVVSLFGA